MASTVITPIATALSLVADDLADVKGILWAPRDTDTRPAIVIEMPELTRREIDEKESQLGTNDWSLQYPAMAYFDLSSDVAYSQGQAVEVLEAFVKALDVSIDAGGRLNGPFAGFAVSDVTLIRAEPAIMDPPDQNTRPTMIYDCIVEVLAFVP